MRQQEATRGFAGSRVPSLVVGEDNSLSVAPQQAECNPRAQAVFGWLNAREYGESRSSLTVTSETSFPRKRESSAFRTWRCGAKAERRWIPAFAGMTVREMW